MPDVPEVHRFAVTLDDLVNEVRVPLEDQLTEQPSGGTAEDGSTWDEERRQLRLGGGG
jgi:hypothetical protein